jgi:hypothetical protein
MNFTAAAALARERVSTSLISNTRAFVHSRPHARPTLPAPMIFSVLIERGDEMMVTITGDDYG